MKNYLAKWPDGTVTILTAKNVIHLFDLLDLETDPFAAEVYQLPRSYQIRTSIEEGKMTFDVYDGEDAAKIKRIKFTAEDYKEWLGV